MNPNQLTTLRFILLFFVIGSDLLHFYYLAILFILLSFLTDHLDGYIARRYKKSSDMGIYYDHFVDKIFVHILLVYYLSLNLVSFWIVAPLIIRDYLALGLRQYAVSHSQVMPSILSGKIKLVSQGVLLVLLALTQIVSFPSSIILAVGTIIVLWSFFSLIDMGLKNKVIMKQLWREL